MIGSTNSIWNVNSKYEQLVNYTMLYDYGDECSDVTGGWTAKSFNTTYPSVGTLTKNADNLYYSVTGSNGSGIATVNLLDISNYKYFATLQKFKANSATWQAAYLTVGRNDKTYIEHIKIGTSTQVTTPTLYKANIENVTENGCLATIINYTGNITLYCAMLFKGDDWQTLSEKAGITATSIDDVLTNAETLLANEEAVEFMIYNCTGEFMISAVASETFLTALNNSQYKTIIWANEHWAKFLNMIS